MSPCRLPRLGWRRCIAGLGGFKPLNHVCGLSPLPVEERFGPPDEAPAATPSGTRLAALGSCLGADIRVNAATGIITVPPPMGGGDRHSGQSNVRRPGRTPNPIGFEAIRITVRMVADAPPEALYPSFVHAPPWSPVKVTTRVLDLRLERKPLATGNNAGSDLCSNRASQPNR